jgi:hypothetical protein
MKLIKVLSKSQAMYYRLNDGRIGIIYPNTGYVRTSSKWISKIRRIQSIKNLTLYQINPKHKIVAPDGSFVHVRVLYENIDVMIEHLRKYEEKNCNINA